MRKATILLVVGLAVVSGAATASAEEPDRSRKLQLALTVVPMAFGRFTSVPGGMKMTEDGAFAYGLDVAAGYEVLPGLSLGVAPQMLLHVKPKTDDGSAYKELDLLARLAYTFRLVDTLAIYAEALPGYSFLLPAGDGNSATGLVVAFGAGAMLDLGARAFALVGGGYQLGFQKVTFDGVTQDNRTKFVRLTIGGGVRF